MIQSIVFDWGGVLIEDPSLKMFEYCAKVLQVSRQEFLRIYEKFIQDFQRGTISEQMLWETICSELKIKKPTLSSLWETAFRQAYVERKENFLLASTLKKNGYRIGLLSNTEVPAMRFFHKQKYGMFDVTVFSCAEGTRKPEERMYQILLQRLQVQPEEVLFIDDNEEYIHGAERARINTVLFKNHRQLRKALSSFL
jgi:epoxide hydrolase-like predicted phosphatase